MKKMVKKKGYVQMKWRKVRKIWSKNDKWNDEDRMKERLNKMKEEGKKEKLRNS